jgi:DNA polymerase-3 subunit alpha (Gram-positive type)
MNSNLAYVGELFGIKHKKAHRALEDARVTAKLLLHYLDFFISRKIKKLNHLYYPRKKYEFDSINFSSDESGVDDVLSVLENTAYPFLLTIKGKKGVILQSLLIVSKKESDLLSIREHLSGLVWDTVTVKLIGHFFKGLVLLGGYFHSIGKSAHEDILKFLTLRYDLPGVSGSSNESKVAEIFKKGFLIVPHLIKDHYSIFALHSLFHSKSELVFRYPIHQKKVLQFIAVHIRQISTIKKRHKIDLTEGLLACFESYLSRVAGLGRKEIDKECFFFHAHDFIQAPKKFRNDLNKFFATHKHTHNYPLEHI